MFECSLPLQQQHAACSGCGKIVRVIDKWSEPSGLCSCNNPQQFEWNLCSNCNVCCFFLGCGKLSYSQPFVHQHLRDCHTVDEATLHAMTTQHDHAHLRLGIPEQLFAQLLRHKCALFRYNDVVRPRDVQNLLLASTTLPWPLILMILEYAELRWTFACNVSCGDRSNNDDGENVLYWQCPNCSEFSQTSCA